MKQVGQKYCDDKISEAKYTHSSDKYLVNLHNSQLHVNFADTSKTYLKLYGHKMPINSFDVSTDDQLAVTGSIDKDIRFWDLQFGQSIKTIFAHSGPVTAVKFVPDTHYVISGGKEGHVKFWDGDTHELILDLEECMGDIRSIAVSNEGESIVAGGSDMGFRVWKKTSEQIVASDQQEKQMEQIMTEDYAMQHMKGRKIKTRYADLKHGEQII